MSGLYFYSISKADDPVPSLINTEDYTYDSILVYEFENSIDQWKKDYASSVMIRHKVIDLFKVASELAGFKVTSMTAHFSHDDFDGYTVRNKSGESKFISDKELDKFRETVEEPGYIYKQEQISETSVWYYFDKNGVKLTGGPLTEEKLIQALLLVVKDQDEYYSSLGEALFAVTKAIEAVRTGKTVFAVID